MAGEDDALEQARNLAAPVQRSRGASSAPTELAEPGDHGGSVLERHREALALTISVTARGREWQLWAERIFALLAIGTGAAVGVSVVALVLVVLVWRAT